MGLVRYDHTANNGQGAFKMTDVGSFITGGVSECKRMINMEIANNQALMILTGILTGVCVISFGLIVYKWYQTGQMDRNINKIQHAELERLKSIRQMPD